jgi:hypothetical protein
VRCQNVRCGVTRRRLHKCAQCGKKLCGFCSITINRTGRRVCCYPGDGGCASKEKRRPAVGSRWKCKKEGRLGTVVTPSKDSPHAVAFQFDGMRTVGLFEIEHFLDWLEPAGAEGER